MRKYRAYYKVHTGTDSKAIESYLTIIVMENNLESAVMKASPVARSLLQNYSRVELLDIQEK